jgi:hypothetical protein
MSTASRLGHVDEGLIGKIVTAFGLEEMLDLSPSIFHIGTFQGAHYSEDVYRPVMTCLMRNTRAQFCVVCQGAIVQSLTPVR